MGDAQHLQIHVNGQQGRFSAERVLGQGGFRGGGRCGFAEAADRIQALWLAGRRDEAIRAVVDAAQTPPFLTDHRVVVAREIGRFNADDVAPLVAYLSDPLPTTHLVLVAGGGRIAKALADAIKAAGALTRGPLPRKGWRR